MMTFMEEAPGVFIIPLYELGECRRIVRRLKRLKKWEAAQVLVGPEDYAPNEITEPDVRSARVLASAHAPDIYHSFEGRLERVVKPLVRRTWRIDLAEHAESQVIRYGIGGHYEAHADGGYFMKERYFTVLCYFNDDFEGGHTSFPGLGYSTTPRCGKAVLFPARYIHRANPVTKGEKFIILSWLVGPVTIDWI